MAGGGDTIHIQELELSARIGVPDEERAGSQRLTVSITLWPETGFAQLRDELEATVDYAAVCRVVTQFVEKREVKLIETLAEEMAAHLLRTFAVQRVQIELRKFILPNVKHVAAVLSREKATDC